MNHLDHMIKQCDKFKKPAIFLQGVIYIKHITELVSRMEMQSCELLFPLKPRYTKSLPLQQKHGQHNWEVGDTRNF